MVVAPAIDADNVCPVACHGSLRHTEVHVHDGSHELCMERDEHTPTDHKYQHELPAGGRSFPSVIACQGLASKGQAMDEEARRARSSKEAARDTAAFSS